jgi:hypothetical protein
VCVFVCVKLNDNSKRHGDIAEMYEGILPSKMEQEQEITRNKTVLSFCRKPLASHTLIYLKNAASEFGFRRSF